MRQARNTEAVGDGLVREGAVVLPARVPFLLRGGHQVPVDEERGVGIMAQETADAEND
jgi:hypothetical protein